MRDGLAVRRYLERLAPDNIVTVTMHAIADAAESSIDARIECECELCFKCMKDAGISAVRFFSYWVPRKKRINAVKLREAGFSLDELLAARDQFRSDLAGHPPVTKLTLFDSQLQQAGYRAEDFKAAGYPAYELSRPWFWSEPDMTAGEIEWEPTHAFFSASDLQAAGYSRQACIMAGFHDAELR